MNTNIDTSIDTDLEAELQSVLAELLSPSPPPKKNTSGDYDENWTPVKYTERKYGPFTESWVHDKEQYDDELNEDELRRKKIVDKLMSIEYPAQRSPEWFNMRESVISASDGGCVVGSNKLEAPYKFIMKKVPPNKYNKILKIWFIFLIVLPSNNSISFFKNYTDSPKPILISFLSYTYD